MLVIGNGHLATRDPEQPFFEDGTVTVGGTTIKKVGTSEEIRRESHDTGYVDAKGGAIMPAFINTREHIYSAMTRSLSIKGYDPGGFLDILDGIWWIIDRRPMGEQTRQSTRATYLDSAKNGVTIVFDHHASFGEVKDSLFAIEDATKEMGIRTCSCYGISDGDGADKTRTAVMGNASWIKHILVDDAGMIAEMMGTHAQFTVSGEAMKLAAANKPAEVGCHIHVAEEIENLRDRFKKYGKRIVDRLIDYNILGEKTPPAHCTYVNPHEIQLIKNTDIMVVHNPESNIGNACGCPPTMETVHRGIFADLRTGGYIRDMTESFRMVNVLCEYHLCDANAAWGKILQMLFEGNVKIASRYFKKQLGVPKEGAVASVTVTDYIPLTPMDAPDINGHILFGMTGRSVVATVCNGKILMRDRELVGPDGEKILYEVRKETKKLAHSING